MVLSTTPSDLDALGVQNRRELFAWAACGSALTTFKAAAEAVAFSNVVRVPGYVALENVGSECPRESAQLGPEEGARLCCRPTTAVGVTEGGGWVFPGV